MNFAREIIYAVSLKNDNGETIDQHTATIYTLLEVPEAHKELEKLHPNEKVDILQYRAVPFLHDPRTAL